MLRYSRVTLITNAVDGVEAQHYGMAYGFADGWSYTWDGENRLTSVAHNGSVVVSNRYDALHRRVQKITPAATKTFFYDDWNLLREVEVTASGVTNRTDYYWGRDLSGTLQGAGGVGGLLFLVRNGASYVPLYDHNGNVTAYVDESGALAAEYTYGAFGELVASSGISMPHRFSTKYYDEETGLYYYGYRFYSPELKRWLNRDPIGESDSFNLYLFVQNNPTCLWDSFGLKTKIEVSKTLCGKWEIRNNRVVVLNQKQQIYLGTKTDGFSINFIPDENCPCTNETATIKVIQAISYETRQVDDTRTEFDAQTPEHMARQREHGNLLPLSYLEGNGLMYAVKENGKYRKIPYGYSDAPYNTSWHFEHTLALARRDKERNAVFNISACAVYTDGTKHLNIGCANFSWNDIDRTIEWTKAQTNAAGVFSMVSEKPGEVWNKALKNWNKKWNWF